MSLYGNIKTISLSSILQMLCQDRKSGILRIWEEHSEISIFLDDGTIIYAMSSKKEQRLGYLLRNTGMISADEIRKSLKEAKEKNQALGKIIVEKGLISFEDLERFMKKKVKGTLLDLFLWERGTFEYTDKKLDLTGHILTNLNSLQLIMEAAKHADEISSEGLPKSCFDDIDNLQLIPDSEHESDVSG